jgi:predicted tellurium resistance membrane protein TerC
VNYLTSGRTPYRQAQGDVEGMQMRARMAGIGIAVVVAIGLIWSVAAMSNLVPVVADSDSAAISRPAG